MVNATRQLLYNGKDPVPIVQVAGCGPRSVWTGAENFVRTIVGSTDRPACSESLYRLSYRGPSNEIYAMPNSFLRSCDRAAS